MLEEKYELTNETIMHLGVVLHRIRALRDIPKYNIKAGDLGGYIEKEDNLSQYGDAWVGDRALVFGDARVFGNAYVGNEVQVFGNVRVFGNARVTDNARVSGNAWMFGNARVTDHARVSGNATVSGNAYISNDNDIFTVGPIGSRNGYTTFCRMKDNNIGVACGCFTGTIDDFLKKVDETHDTNKYAKEYYAAADLARIHIKLE